MYKTFKEAKLNGEKHYFTGIPCKNNHISKRLVSDRGCLECKKQKRKIIYAANPEKFRLERKEYYTKNSEKEKSIARIRSAKWRELNPNHEGIKAAKKAYKKSSLGKIKAYTNTAQRRASKLQRTPKWLTPIDFERIENEYKLAAILTKIWGEPWHVDHIIPLQGKLVSGLHVPSNLKAVRGIENVRKANRYIPA